MTYKYFILKNKLPDSIDSYTKYQEQHGELYKTLNPGMKKQFIQMNYKSRFLIQ